MQVNAFGATPFHRSGDWFVAKNTDLANPRIAGPLKVMITGEYSLVDNCGGTVSPSNQDPNNEKLEALRTVYQQDEIPVSSIYPGSYPGMRGKGSSFSLKNPDIIAAIGELDTTA